LDLLGKMLMLNPKKRSMFSASLFWRISCCRTRTNHRFTFLLDIWYGWIDKGKFTKYGI
jgi:hypothetical protein